MPQAGLSVFDTGDSAIRDRKVWVLVAISVLIHLLMVPLLMRAASSGGGRLPAPQALLRAEPERPEPDVRAGIERSENRTLTWLGFAQPEEHSARPDTIDQAAFSPGQAIGEPVPPAEPSPGERFEAGEAAVAAARAREASQNAERTAQAVQAVERSVAETATAASALAQTIREQAMLAVALAQREAGEQQSSSARESPTPTETVAQQPADTGGAEPDATGEQALKSGQEAAVEQAQPSEKESPATSIAEAVRVKPGKPAAAQGLDITTVRPRWTLVTRISALPRNPVVVVEFRKDGTVGLAQFVEGRATGDQRVDGPLIDAIYNWSAKGKALDDLPPDGVVRMTFSIDLGGR